MRDHKTRFEDLSRAEQIELDPSFIQRARDHIRTLELPGTPNVEHARTIRAAGLPFWAGTRMVVEVDVAHGNPEHGEMRSDDHISNFEIECPFEAIEMEHIRPECPDCGYHRARYQYNAYHYISGFEEIRCTACESELYGESWG